MLLSDSILEIKGIGEKTASLFAKASVFCVKDILLYFPRNYISYPDVSYISEIKKGCINAVSAKIATDPILYSSKGKTILSFDVFDETGRMKIYYFNMPYMKNRFRRGMDIFLYGLVPYESKGNIMSNPSVSTKEEYEIIKSKMRPVYPLVKGLSNNKISESISKVLGNGINLKDFIDENKRKEYDLLEINEAIKLIHFPQDMEDVIKARRRLAFNEFFVFLYNMKRIKGNDLKIKSEYVFDSHNETKDFIDKLPFELTDGQISAINEVNNDLSSGFCMNRLLQGDVGSGKTIVAIIACLNAFYNGFQSAIMAPTVVLAMQHYNDLCEMNEKYQLGIKVELLTGSMKAKERKQALLRIESGEANIIIGTHALITEKVVYKNLALAIVDEQHRFGVNQRLALTNKGRGIHLLVMSATPIPRTLGLILYGDMDISVIKEKPKNRKPLKNAVVGPEFRAKNYKFIADQIKEGHQAYIICPMVLEGEMEGLKNVETYEDEIRPFFDDSVRILSLHGKMKDSVKDEIMEEFKNHNADILISTTVIEVGVNVPNSTVIMIENADRFGLSQLHQLRGRVGRGEDQAYAIFVTENTSKEIMDRLSILSKSNDGFYIAEEDLKLRGPGDFFGYRQSGNPMFKTADIYTDADILKLAKKFTDETISTMQNIEDNDMTRGLDDYLDFGILCL